MKTNSAASAEFLPHETGETVETLARFGFNVTITPLGEMNRVTAAFADEEPIEEVPSIPWETLPNEIKWVTMDFNGQRCGWEREPINHPLGLTWFLEIADGLRDHPVYIDFDASWGLGWRESKVQRPS